MTARNEEREKRIWWLFVTVEERCEDMSVQVIHAVDRLVERECERFGCRDADDEATDQPGALRYRNRVDLGKPLAGASKGIVDGGREQSDVLAARNFRNDPTIFFVKGVLICRNAGENEPPVANDGGRGIVAGRLDAEDEHASCFDNPASGALQVDNLRERPRRVNAASAP